MKNLKCKVKRRNSIERIERVFVPLRRSENWCLLRWVQEGYRYRAHQDNGERLLRKGRLDWPDSYHTNFLLLLEPDICVRQK